MWNLKDSNVRVGIFMKLQSYKKHLNNLKNTKSSLSIKNTKPWKPTFKLSRNTNRYHKTKAIQIDQQNNHLVRKIMDINEKPDINTLMEVPFYVPSNKQNYQMFKNRQRSERNNQIFRQNSTISVKINSASKSYDRRIMSKDWLSSRKYKQNISKMTNYCDYRKMANMSARNTRKTLNLNLNFRQRDNQQKNTSQNYSEIRFQTTANKFKKVV